MAKRNYNKISTEQAKTSDIDHSVEETEVVEEVVEVEKKVGVVVNCPRLNVRSKPNLNGQIVTVITKDTEVEIDESKSKNDFYYVLIDTGTEGYTGYCMKKYIEIK